MQQFILSSSLRKKAYKFPVYRTTSNSVSYLMPTFDIDVLCQQQSTSGHIQKIVCLPSLDSVLNFGLEGFFQSHRNIQQRIDLQITGLQNITIITRYQYMQSIKYLDQVLFLHSVVEGKQKSFKSGISHINAQFPCLQTLASVTKKVTLYTGFMVNNALLPEVPEQKMGAPELSCQGLDLALTMICFPCFDFIIFSSQRFCPPLRQNSRQ